MLAKGAISWSSKKQLTIALSSMEAEYTVAATEAANKTIQICRSLEDLCYKQNGPGVIFDDNQSCLILMKDHMFHACIKHIEINITYT